MASLGLTYVSCHLRFSYFYYVLPYCLRSNKATGDQNTKPVTLDSYRSWAVEAYTFYSSTQKTEEDGSLSVQGPPMSTLE